MLTQLALLAIRGYQRYLSPVKGFSCALRVATGGASCSAYGYSVIERRGVGIGLRLLRRRLHACGQVHRVECSKRHGALRYQGGFCEPSCDVGDIGDCDLHDVFKAFDWCSCDTGCGNGWGKEKPKSGGSGHLASLKKRISGTRRERERAKQKR